MTQPSLFDPPKPKRLKPERVEYDDESLSAAEKRQIVLARLEAGPLSTVEAERLVHRGQAYIGSLRNCGHIIWRRTIDGRDFYIYQGREHCVRATKKLQAMYYRTPHWIRLARERKEFDKFRCQVCKSESNLETHHLRYFLFAEDMERDLITLCEPCHKAMHESASGSTGMHFPHAVSESIAKRIREEGK